MRLQVGEAPDEHFGALPKAGTMTLDRSRQGRHSKQEQPGRERSKAAGKVAKAASKRKAANKAER